MRINNQNQVFPKTAVSTPQKDKLATFQQQSVSNFCSYPAVYFCGKISQHNAKKMAAGFIRELDDILKNEITEKEMTPEEIHFKELERKTAHLKTIIRRQYVLIEQAQILKNTKNINYQQYENEKNRILKEVNRNFKEKDKSLKYTANTPQKEDVKTDFILINKFKSAVIDSDFDLRKVFINHYKELKNISTVGELKSKYPKMPVPKDPKEVVAKKVENSLTRDFYEELHHLLKKDDKKSARDLCEINIKKIIAEGTKNCSEEEQTSIYEKIKVSAGQNIIKKYKRLKEQDSFSIVPENRKIKSDLISDTDRKMLSIDYDKFVLNTLSKQYLKFEKPNNIVYTEGKTVIKISDLSNSDYKIEKIPGKIINLIKTGDKYKAIQRDYDNFSIEDFQERLDFFADRLDSNEYYLQDLINFSTCHFLPEDITTLKSFLRESDKVLDGEQTMKEAMTNIYTQNLHPRGTQKNKEIERQAELKRIKEIAKKHNELTRMQTSFDDEINILFQNDMAYIAEICSEYRPVSTEADNSKAELLISIFNKYKDKNNPDKIINKDKLATEITRWSRYDLYKSADPQNPILLKAEAYAKKNNGEIDYNKAGKYILNAEAVATYPQSFELARDRSAAETIMEAFKTDKNKAIEYLCKYDDYLDLNKFEKSKINNILNIFDVKNPVDKSFLKTIIEKEYVACPTKETTVNENMSKKVISTITPKAKHEILDYYKFPQCLDYFKAFEEALKTFAPPKGNSGVKHLGGNNKTYKDFIELKIKLSDDRIMCYNGSYIFDEFVRGGFH